MRKLRHFRLVACGLLAVWCGSAYALPAPVPAPTAEDFVDVVRADDRLTPEQREQLAQVIAARLAGVDLDNDKGVRGLPQFADYYQALTGRDQRGKGPSRPLYFQYIKASIDHQMHQYARLPSLSLAERVALEQRFKLVQDFVEQCILTAYTDTPPDIRQKIVEDTRRRVEKRIVPEIGNYFAPHMLLLHGDALTQADLQEALPRIDPFIHDVGSAFAEFDALLKSDRVAENTKPDIIDAFVSRESSRFRSNARRLMRGHGPNGLHLGKYYVEPPLEMRNLGDQLNEVLRTEYEARRAKSMEEANRERAASQQ